MQCFESEDERVCVLLLLLLLAAGRSSSSLAQRLETWVATVSGHIARHAFPLKALIREQHFLQGSLAATGGPVSSALL